MAAGTACNYKNLHLQTSYPVVWEAKGAERMKLLGQKEYTALAYIVKKKANVGCFFSYYE